LRGPGDHTVRRLTDGPDARCQAGVMDNTGCFYRVFRVWGKKFAVQNFIWGDFRAQIVSKSQLSAWSMNVSGMMVPRI
jgi:hypothetical protein